MIEEEIKHWTAQRISALNLEIILSKTWIVVASPQFDLTPAKIER